MWNTIGKNIGEYRNYPRIVGGRVGDDEVLAAGLADDARVVAVARRCSSPIVCHIPLKTPVEPVKWMPARSRAASAGVADRRAAGRGPG